MGADLRIQGTDRPSGVFEVGTDRSVGRGRTFVEISDFQGQKKFFQSLPVPCQALDSLAAHFLDEPRVFFFSRPGRGIELALSFTGLDGGTKGSPFA